jgi:ankyrin repeat domain-containing protein 50
MEKTDEDIRTALKTLPTDLSGTFCRILQKAGMTGARYQRKILEFVAAAIRPLTTDELREALGVVLGEPVWNPSKFVNDIETTLGCCGSLITIDEEELTVRFAHHSIKQFLVGKMGYPPNKLRRKSPFVPKSPLVPPDYHFELEDAGRLMGHTIVTYLNYGVFDTQLSRVVVPKIQAKEAPSKVMNSVLDNSKSRHSVKHLAIGLLRSRKQSSFDIGKVLSDARDSVQPSSAGDFQFLSYAKTYWLHHTMSFGIQNFLGESKTILPLWQKVVMKYITVRNLPFKPRKSKRS